ncbi:uncharacterized protein SCHCODRAFT_02685210 [Schizophyllum commune H4-8]|uniref:uncharacterized protein n=1 Tax=Schizophyllum commune (strain H4-8 / FGSC 9210) TaxID=578458 RepID=UPI0021605AB3|nr:uncharacterized protein SCHCODRAFT_02685210 [Schizophyllum commune H4-8]KAI5896144.1 hypothetical protein SCHCODRAFT_02685210 [Schizophyllum commune H4-8]
MIGVILGTFIPALCNWANQLASVMVAPKNSRCIQAAAEPGPKPTISSRRASSHSSGMMTTISKTALPICAITSLVCASSAPRTTRTPTIASVAFPTIAFTACRRASCVGASSGGVASSAIAVSKIECMASPTAWEATSSTFGDASSLSKASSPAV